MALTIDGYKKRLIDKKITEYLEIFGALSIDGPKWCGKTWTSLNHANTKYFINPINEGSIRLIKISPDNVLNGKYPILIDEWQIVPEIWDYIRRKCDEDKIKGKYILTGSATQKSESIYHSGAGRICKLRMHTMTLFESGDSVGVVSLNDMFKNKIKNQVVPKLTLEQIANLIIRGGWPENIGKDGKKAQIIAKSYINDILNKDIYDIDNIKRDKNKMEMLLKSLARNESTLASNKTLINDIIENEKDSINRETVGEYLDVLNRLFLIENQAAYNPNIRSRQNIGKSPKRHFTDPSLACALLNLNYEKLIKDLKTFGFLFEALVERDLRIYSEYNNGELRHFRNNVTGLEIDAIILNEDGEYGAIEIKLGPDELDEATEKLLKFYEVSDKKPKFMCIICGLWENVVKDPKTGIYILPITALKP